MRLRGWQIVFHSILPGYAWRGSKQVPRSTTDGAKGLCTKSAIDVFACHYVVLLLTFCLNWKVLHPPRSMPTNVVLSLRDGLCVIRWNDRMAEDDCRSGTMREESERTT